MNWLLKIVEGPMKGAEIALVNGMRLKVGSGTDCDIVIADSTVSATAFELDVADTAVTQILPDESAIELLPFEVKTFGTSAFAVGPAEGDWQELVRKIEVPKAAPAPVEEPKVEASEKPAEESVTEAESAADEGETKVAEPEEEKRGGRGLGCVMVFALLIALVVIIVYLFRARPEPIRGYIERCDPYLQKTTDWVKSTFASVKGSSCEANASDSAKNKVLSSKQKLEALANEHGLIVADDNGRILIKGNVERRTERMAIRALALGIDNSVKFDLTDDESLKNAANELLFAFAGGSLRADSASNRVVRISGFAEDANELEQAIRALDADVKGIEFVDTKMVKLGLMRRPIPVVPSVAENVVDKSAPELTAPPPVLKKNVKVSPKKYPVAGILMKPYPCVVMRNGHRIAEGAEIGTAQVVKIEADRLILQDGGKTFEWRP